MFSLQKNETFSIPPIINWSVLSMQYYGYRISEIL
jgi:hypothetical protein